jgi:uncharacterized flavoprotein (TIGR03862 family)
MRPPPTIAIIGAGPAGLCAAEYLAGIGHSVTVYDRMASPGRKFLLAGRSGLNLTHTEPAAAFMARYGEAEAFLRPALQAFRPAELRAWCEGLGQPVFVGSSGRVFPIAMKAAPLLRAWLRRLDALGVRFAPRHQWQGWAGEGALRFATPDGDAIHRADATLLALGGASWPRMGSDGQWVSLLRARGVSVAPWRPSNVGVLVAWSEVFRRRFEGVPLKRIAVSAGGAAIRGEVVVTQSGIEGGPVYSLSAMLRRQIDTAGQAMLHIDLLPDMALEALAQRTDGPRDSRSFSTFLRKQAGLPPVCIGLVQEALHTGAAAYPLSRLLKALPVRVIGLQPIERAISSAGGIELAELDEQMMLVRLPGVFAAGEMLDWEAPTGGYLLQACFSTGMCAARGIGNWLQAQQ